MSSDSTGPPDGYEPFASRRLHSGGGVDLLLRSAEPSDGASILEIISLVTAEGFYFISLPEELNATVQETEEWIARQLDQPGNLVLVAEVSGRVVGFAELERGRRRRVAHLGQISIYLRQEWRQLGIGRVLLESLLAWAERSPHIEKVCLSVFASNQRALRFYRRFGFEEEGRKIREFKLDGHTYDDEILMFRFVKDTSLA
ncbi:MAG: GNAT family N-acetyltransferase [Bradymonadales bacterium]|nr:GNAT family N-acetyltransferase [Bradymonadales bacterium]